MWPHNRRHLRVVPLLKIVAIVVVCYFSGLYAWIFETKYKDLDSYINSNTSKYIEQLEAKLIPDGVPTNSYDYNFIHNCSKKCDVDNNDSRLQLVYIVKSAVDHFVQRDGIRNSWGFEKRFSDVSIRTFFLLGLPLIEKVQSKINYESQEKKDIIQANFVDTYFNNTIKTMIGIKWAVQFCSHSKFYFFSDDDMYVSTKNILKFVRNPLEYPQYLEVPFANLNEKTHKGTLHQRPLGQVFDIELPEDAELYAGYMFPNSRPHRHYISKWYMTLEEYPFSKYPPYITAGAYILSRRALQKFYYASFYIKHFRFDDIYLAMLAIGSHISPVHNDEFYFYKKPYNVEAYRYVIASHGYEDPNELKTVWNEQRSAGNA